MRTYEKTHPWISYQIDLRRASPRFWLKLGEATSKCEHIAGVTLRPTIAQRLHWLYLAKGVQATTAIEGNSLTEEQVLKRLEGKLELPQSKEHLAQEIDNVAAACNEISETLKAGKLQLTRDRICDFNRTVLKNLAPQDNLVPGEIRKHSVVVGTVYRGAPAEDCDYLLTRLCAWLSGPNFEPPAEMATVYAIIKAVTAHLYLAWIHPFGDGNGRTARLVELQILLAAGIPTPAAHLLSNHYNETRAEYYRQLGSASKSGGDIVPFVEYAVAGFVDGLREQLAVIREQQWDAVWRNYVHESFRDRSGTASHRQRHLVLDLSRRDAPVPAAQLPDLSPRLARVYAQKSSKTLQRDLDAVEKMGLVERTPSGVRARRETILAFLPWRKETRGDREIGAADK